MTDRHAGRPARSRVRGLSFGSSGSAGFRSFVGNQASYSSKSRRTGPVGHGLFVDLVLNLRRAAG